MLYNIDMRLENSDIDIDIEYLDIEVYLLPDGSIDGILIDGKLPTFKQAKIINDNLRIVQEEVGYRWMEHEKNKHHPMWAEV